MTVQRGGDADPAAGGATTATPGTAQRARAESRLRALTEIGRAAMTAPADEALEAVVRAARLALDAASASLGVWEPEEGHLRTLLNEGELADWERPRPADEVYPADQYDWLALMGDGHLGLVMNRDDPSVPLQDREFLAGLGKESSLTVPVLLHGEWWGEVYVTRRADQPRFTEDDLDWASAVAAQVAAALEALEQLGKAADLARTDALTGLANRLAVNEWMLDAMGRWRDEGARVGLVVCDVNGLKQVNDTQGHELGDRLLMRFAEELGDVAAAHSASLLARLGGDEFCVAFVDADADTVVAAADEVARRGWESLPFGVAVGVACTGGEAGTVDSVARLFRLADAAQYRAKHSGSRHPVVAGRALPADAAVTLVEPVAAPVADRRLLRAPQRHDLAGLLEVALRSLDEAGDEPARARLALVGDLVAQHVDAAGWWLSLALPGRDLLQTTQFTLYRALSGLPREALDAELTSAFPLDQYVSSARALDGGGFAVLADDPDADAGERETLQRLGATAVVAAGVRESEGTGWLLEVVTDELSGPVTALPAALRLLVLAAVHPEAVR